MLDKCSNVKRMKSGKFKITKKNKKKQIKMLKNQLNSIKQLSPHVQTMLKTADAHVLLKTSVQLYTSSKKNSYCKTIVLAR